MKPTGCSNAVSVSLSIWSRPLLTRPQTKNGPAAHSSGDAPAPPQTKNPRLRGFLCRIHRRSAGRREVPGRPLTYATTAGFLSQFGLASRRDLPGIDDLKAAGLLDPVDLAFEAAFEDEASETVTEDE